MHFKEDLSFPFRFFNLLIDATNLYFSHSQSFITVCNRCFSPLLSSLFTLHSLIPSLSLSRPPHHNRPRGRFPLEAGHALVGRGHRLEGSSQTAHEADWLAGGQLTTDPPPTPGDSSSLRPHPTRPPVGPVSGLSLHLPTGAQFPFPLFSLSHTPSDED
ncbi:unnamed protein product [Protopolystoma xenopodis]|uniref:Uncharacterized protein n=1 Tax=Protopolystoma xenopodis TaxID=117903 RepID=A0A3S5AWF8_9PLAT|nr:unnamed protein product [Protopolystoma xenopodis]